ncbi:hypothetical protein [Stenoxybacter acetivorans]|uniref:hypothetical protein n=1 Tax=Stenoxybacter acetivorans TaxID=422441 RepID=UPI0005650F05|nr:hypothetical protein [Stenoxybacter acetivorans]
MQPLLFPLDFHFKIFTPSNDFNVFDAQRQQIAYTRQQFFRIKEAVDVFTDNSRREKRYTIRADRIIDFNARYTIFDNKNTELGQIRRQGMKSLWRTHYSVYDTQSQLVLDIQEANPWIAVLNGLVSEVPVLGWLSGYFLNPKYALLDSQGHEQYRLKKQASFWERRYRLEKHSNKTDITLDNLAAVACMMLVLQERRDG